MSVISQQGTSLHVCELHKFGLPTIIKEGIRGRNSSSAVCFLEPRQEAIRLRRAKSNPMREYMTVPTRVEVVCAREIIAASAENLQPLPVWARECHERGQMVIAATGVTVFNGAIALRAKPDDFIVCDQNGFFSVFDAPAFQQNFVSAHQTEPVKLLAA